MVSKKCLVFSLVLVGFLSKGVSQEKLWDWNDKGYVPESQESRFKEFTSNKNPYPVKPKSAWELSVGGGPSFVIGDVNPKLGFGGSVTLRKAINNIFSYRFGYFGSLNQGKGSEYNYSGLGFAPSRSPNTINYRTLDYKNQTHSVAFDIVASINTFSNYRGDPKSNLYLLGGLDLIASKTQYYDYNTNQWGWLRTFPLKGTIIPTSSKDKTDKSYKGTAWFWGYSYGVGYAYKINRKLNIAVEERLTTSLFGFDYVDGYAGTGKTKDTYYYTAFKINYNLIK